MAEVFSRGLLKIAVAQICQGLGWHAVQTTPCEVLTDVVERYIRQLAEYTHRYSEQYGKTDPTLEDLGLALHDMGFSISELNTYIKEVEPIPFAKTVPCFPVPRSSSFQHPLPGSKHCRERLHYIPDYLPPLVSIKGETDTSDLVDVSDFSHSTSANGVLHDGTDSNLKSPKGTGPNFDTPFTPPRPEKRSLQSPYDGHDSKRMRLVEEGTPQELKTVTMEANGILTPKREGKLPDACTPPPKFTDKPKQKSSTSPLAEPSKQKTTLDITKLSSKEPYLKKTVKEIESKKTPVKSDAKKQNKDSVADIKKLSENIDTSKNIKISKTNNVKKSPKQLQVSSPTVTKQKTSQKSPKPSFNLFSSESSFKYPTKQKSLDKPEVVRSKSPAAKPESPKVQVTKKSDVKAPPTKTTSKKSDIYDFDDDEFDSSPKGKSDSKLQSPPPAAAESKFSAMQEAFRSAVAKGRQEMESVKAKQSSTQSSSDSDEVPSLKLDTSPVNNPTDAAISAVIKKKQKNKSLEKNKEAYLPPKFAFKQALREQEAALKNKKTKSSSSIKKKKIKKDNAKDMLHSVKNTVIKKQKKIHKDKEKKLKIASNILVDAKESKKKPDLTFKVKMLGGETKIVKDGKEESKLAPIPKLNIKRKNSTSLQVVQVKPEVHQKEEKKKDKKSKDKFKKKKLKIRTQQDQGDTKKGKTDEPLVPKITLTFGSSSTGEGSKRFVIKPIKPPSPDVRSPSPAERSLSPIPQPPSPGPPVLTPNITSSPVKTTKKKKPVKPASPLPPPRPITPTTTPSPTSKSPPIEIKLDSKIFSPYNFDSDSSNQSLETPRTPTTSPTPLFPKPDISPSASPTYKYSPPYKAPVSPTYNPDSPIEVKPFDLQPVKTKEPKATKKSMNQNKKTEKVKKSGSPANSSASKSTPERKAPSTKAKSSPKTISPTPACEKPEPMQTSASSPSVWTETISTPKANKTKTTKLATPSTKGKAKAVKGNNKTSGITKAKKTEEIKAQKFEEVKSQKLEEVKAKKAEEVKAKKAEEVKAKKAEERSVVTETIGTVVAETEEKIWICPTCQFPDDGSPMIGCDNCDDWYHWPCVKIVKEPPEDQDWYCPKCRKKKKKKKKF
ncbi:uncharacterized protein [Antedon mediterranea]|uniref:uncharacterized protein n=1 Tax=Antedon mediterranea TaxID=105859 RepID=UPI003AF90AAA